MFLNDSMFTLSLELHYYKAHFEFSFPNKHIEEKNHHSSSLILYRDKIRFIMSVVSPPTTILHCLTP